MQPSASSMQAHLDIFVAEACSLLRLLKKMVHDAGELPPGVIGHLCAMVASSPIHRSLMWMELEGCEALEPSMISGSSQNHGTCAVMRDAGRFNP